MATDDLGAGEEFKSRILQIFSNKAAWRKLASRSPWLPSHPPLQGQHWSLPKVSGAKGSQGKSHQVGTMASQGSQSQGWQLRSGVGASEQEGSRVYTGNAVRFITAPVCLGFSLCFLCCRKGYE